MVQHLHDFARDVKLTEEKWMKGVQYLTAIGQKCDTKRQEFILLSDGLGLSMLTVVMNHDKPAGCTESAVFGPFFLEEAPHYPLGADVANGAKGDPCKVTGSVLGLGVEIIPNARINVWQADAEGLYDVQHINKDCIQARGVLHSDACGSFHFKTILAQAYPIPVDGPVGQLLEATKRHPWRPAHLHFMYEAPGYERLITHVFREDGQYLNSDAVFGVRQTLIANWPAQADGSYTVNYDFVLNPKPGLASEPA